jgi:hypothetical protein
VAHGAVFQTDDVVDTMGILMTPGKQRLPGRIGDARDNELLLFVDKEQ